MSTISSTDTDPVATPTQSSAGESASRTAVDFENKPDYDTFDQAEDEADNHDYYDPDEETAALLIRRLYIRGAWSDVEIKVSGRNGGTEYLTMHSAIIFARCPRLAKLACKNPTVSTASALHLIDFTNFSRAVVESLFFYLYGQLYDGLGPAITPNARSSSATGFEGPKSHGIPVLGRALVPIVGSIGHFRDSWTEHLSVAAMAEALKLPVLIESAISGFKVDVVGSSTRALPAVSVPTMVAVLHVLCEWGKKCKGHNGALYQARVAIVHIMWFNKPPLMDEAEIQECFGRDSSLGQQLAFQVMKERAKADAEET